MYCVCGFKFAGPGEFRNCEAFTLNGQSGIVCPDCKREYISGVEVDYLMFPGNKNERKETTEAN